MAGFHRGTTPTNVFNVNVDLRGATVFVTYAQRDCLTKISTVKIEKTGTALTIDEDSVTCTLTQAETLELTEGQTEIQIRYVNSSGMADASNIITVDTERILKDGVITYAV